MAFIDKTLPGFEWMALENDAPVLTDREIALRARQSAQRAADRARAIGAPRNPEGIADPEWLTTLEAHVKAVTA